VLAEYLTFFAGSRPSIGDRAARNVEVLINSLEVRIVPQSRETFLAGLQLYRARSDKGYSMVDCISMQTMRRENPTDVLTNDKHFEQDGFHAFVRGY
jgi:predicted nucleic acid-binding protein